MNKVMKLLTKLLFIMQLKAILSLRLFHTTLQSTVPNSGGKL